MPQKLNFLVLLLLFGIIPTAFAQRVDTVPEPTEVDFVINRRIPSDIQEQISWFPGSFGGGGPGGCIDNVSSPLRNWRYPSDNRISILEGGLGWCLSDEGLSANLLNSLSASIILPNGRSEEIRVRVENTNRYDSISFSYAFGVGSQLGTYEVELSGGGRSWTDRFTLFLPQTPTVRRTRDFERSCLLNDWLVGFEPEEQIRIIAFEYDRFEESFNYYNSLAGAIRISFVSQMILETDSNGMLIINYERYCEERDLIIFYVSLDNDWFYTSIERSNVIGTVWDSLFNNCQDVQEPHLSIGDRARVANFNNGLPVRLRVDPGLNGEFLESLETGTAVEIQAGPACIDGYWWWGIETNTGLQGWAAGGDDEDYYLEGR